MKKLNALKSKESSPILLRISSKPPSLEYHLDSRNLVENHRISSERAKGTKRVEGAFCEFLSRISFSLFFLFFPSFPHEHLLHAASWAWNRFRCTDIRRHPGVILRFSLLTADSFRFGEILPFSPSFQPSSKTESRPRFFGFIHAKLAAE